MLADHRGMLLVFIAVYFAVIELIGYYYSKRMKSMDDFLMAGRNLGTWVLVGTIVGTNIGGGTVMGLTGAGTTQGLSGVWTGLFAYIFIFIWAILFAKYTNRIKQYTISDFLVMRFGERMRVPAAFFLMLRAIVQTGMQIVALGSVIASILGWSLNLSMVVAMFFTLLICLFGGMLAVIVTDAIQAIMQTLGPLFLMWYVIQDAGGIGVIYEATASIDPDFWNLLAPGLPAIIGLMFSQGFYYFVYQPTWSRAFVAKDEQTAFNSQIIGAIICAVFLFVPIITGLGASLIAPDGMAESQILPWLYMNKFNRYFGAFFVASLLSAVVTVLDSMVLDATTNFTRDIYQARINKNASEKQLVFISRVAVVAISCLGLAIGMSIKNLIVLWIFANVLCSGGLVIPAFAAWFSKKATSAGAYWAMICGGAATIVWSIINWIVNGNPGKAYLGIEAVYVGFVIGIVTLIIVSMNSKHTDEENIDSTYYWTAVKQPTTDASLCVARENLSLNQFAQAILN